MTREELQIWFSFFIKDSKYYQNRKLLLRKTNRETSAYVQWSRSEIRRAINNLSKDCDNPETEYDAFYEFKNIYMVQLGDWVEVFQITHSKNTVNPFEILMNLCHDFLDYMYDIATILGGDYII